MSQSEGIIFIVTSIVTLFIMVFFDKKVKFSEYLREKFNINNRSKGMLFSVILAILLILVLLPLIRLDFYSRTIIAGLCIGVLGSISSGINSTFTKKQNL